MHSNLANRPNAIRPDGVAKVTGKLNYLTDLVFPHMLYGKVLRSSYPHAIIHAIHTKKAESLPGVEAVITHKDVPGLNGFGLIFPDQPVLCENRVRYIGDAIAAVAAVSAEIAEEALQLIEVEYEVLPPIIDPEEAMKPDCFHLHPKGNILHHAHFKKGSPDEAFKACSVITQQMYELPRQMHAYMETEGGVVVPEKNGCFTVYAGTQHGFKDRFQLARIMDIEEERIRVVSSPMGGSFGGKDELNNQPYGMLLAQKTGCPIKLHNSRTESINAGLKRHPMKIVMKTGTNSKGKLMAHQTSIIADTGAYATLGPAVLDFAIEHAAGPYSIPHVETEGWSVFTNNGVAGEFRGFGGNQITFALESQMDRLAEILSLDRVMFRKMNLRKAEDPGPMGHRIAPPNGADDVLLEVEKRLQQNKTDQKHEKNPWLRKGTGIAIAMHGGGLGYGRLDDAGGRISLSKDGKIEVSFGFEECGQGLLSVIENLTTEEFACTKEDIKIIIGDTDAVPVSGSSTASRGTSMVWHSLKKLKGPFQDKVLKEAASLLNMDPSSLTFGKGGIWEKGIAAGPSLTYQDLIHQSDEEFSFTTKFPFPVTPDPVDGGHFLYAFGGIVVDVEADLITGKIKIASIDHVIAAGPVVSPQGYRGQIEGGGVMSLGYALMEEAKMIDGVYGFTNFDRYLIPGIADVPFDTNVYAIEDLYDGDQYGPRGVGEIGTISIAPAIASAVHDCLGIWMRKLPITQEEILAEIERKGLVEWM